MKAKFKTGEVVRWNTGIFFIDGKPVDAKDCIALATVSKVVPPKESSMMLTKVHKSMKVMGHIKRINWKKLRPQSVGFRYELKGVESSLPFPSDFFEKYRPAA